LPDGHEGSVLILEAWPQPAELGRKEAVMLRAKALLGRLPLLALVLALVALLALACEEEEEEAPSTDGATPTPTALKAGAAGIPSNPRDVRGLEDVLVLEDGLAIWKERPASESRIGVTEDTIRLGWSTALTGPFAAYGYATNVEVAREIVKRVNEAGGIHGRNIELFVRDDQYNPVLAVDAVKGLVEVDEAFAIIFGAGTPSIISTYSYTHENGVPWIAAWSGASEFAEPTLKTVFIGNQIPRPLEGLALGDYILDQQPDAKIAVIYQNDTAGGELLVGLKTALEKAGKGEIVAEIAYEVGTPDPTAHVRQAVESGATYLAALTYGGLGQIPKVLVETIGATLPMVVPGPGVYTSAGVGPAGSENYDGVTGIDPFGSPETPALAKFAALYEELGKTATGTMGTFDFDWEVLTRALELAGPDLTREGLIEALEIGFDGSWTCGGCLGPIVYGPQDHWALESFRFVSWSHADQKFVQVSDVVNYETSEGEGLRGNVQGFECEPPSAAAPEGTCPWEEGG
jgi:branched-chain amino acid transport system substrate-binding protein